MTIQWVQCGRALALLSGALLGLAACGGEPSKNSFVADADLIRRNDGAPLASVRTPTSFPELAETAGKISSAVETQLPKLRALDRPSGDDIPINALFGSLRGVADAARALQTSAAGKDEKGTATAAVDLSNRGKAAADSGRVYGFATCGGSVQPAVNASLDGAKNVLKAGFVVKAEALCREASSQLDDIPEASNLRGAARAFDQGAAILDKLIGDLRALAAPPGDEATLSDFYSAQQEVSDKAKQAGSAARAGNERLLESHLDEFDVLTTAANAKADAYGIPDCGTKASF